MDFLYFTYLFIFYFAHHTFKNFHFNFSLFYPLPLGLVDWDGLILETGPICLPLPPLPYLCVAILAPHMYSLPLPLLAILPTPTPLPFYLLHTHTFPAYAVWTFPPLQALWWSSWVVRLSTHAPSSPEPGKEHTLHYTHILCDVLRTFFTALHITPPPPCMHAWQHGIGCAFHFCEDFFFIIFAFAFACLPHRTGQDQDRFGLQLLPACLPPELRQD